LKSTFYFIQFEYYGMRIFFLCMQLWNFYLYLNSFLCCFILVLYSFLLVCALIVIHLWFVTIFHSHCWFNTNFKNTFFIFIEKYNHSIINFSDSSVKKWKAKGVDVKKNHATIAKNTNYFKLEKMVMKFDEL
jgi:hypothetical protein